VGGCNITSCMPQTRDMTATASTRGRHSAVACACVGVCATADCNAPGPQVCAGVYLREPRVCSMASEEPPRQADPEEVQHDMKRQRTASPVDNAPAAPMVSPGLATAHKKGGPCVWAGSGDKPRPTSL
jgi:hypothetical protein